MRTQKYKTGTIQSKNLDTTKFNASLIQLIKEHTHLKIVIVSIYIGSHVIFL